MTCVTFTLEQREHSKTRPSAQHGRRQDFW